MYAQKQMMAIARVSVTEEHSNEQRELRYRVPAWRT